MIDRLRYGLPQSADRVLNHLIAWAAILLVLSIVGFGGYYYYDRYGGSTGPTPAERALADAEGAVVSDPSSLNARLHLAELYYGANRFKESAEQSQAALSIDEKNVVGLWALGRALFAAGDANAAEPNFQKIVDISQDNDIRGDMVGASYYYLAKIALARNDADKAVEDANRAAAIDAGDADAIELLGAAYVAKGSYDDAIKALASAVSFVPDFAEAYTQLAVAYNAKGMANEARYAHGMELFSQGQLSKAAKELETASAALPDFAPAFTGLGLTREKQGQHDAAINAYQRALSLDDTSFNARAGLVRLGVIQATDTTPGHSDSHGGGQ